MRAILELELKGESLRCRHVRAANWPLAAAAILHFGCWGNALTAAGLDREKVANRRTWTAQRVIDAIHDLARRGVGLSYRAAYQADAGLLQAARKTLGSWNEALRAAGYDPEQIRARRRPWTREQIIDLIRQRAAAGLPIASYSVRPLSAEIASRRIFGSWRLALKAAGVRDPMVTYPIWTKVTVVEGVLRRQQEGKPLYCLAVAQQDHRLYDAARRCFGYWKEALREAGIAPETVRRRHSPYTCDDIREYLRQHWNSSRPQPRHYRESIVHAARKLFGSWAEALQASGCIARSPRNAKRPASREA